MYQTPTGFIGVISGIRIQDPPAPLF